MSKWLEDPERTLFSLRREVRDGAREQWAIVARDGGVEVLHLDAAGAAWQVGGERFADLRAVLEGLPELRTTWPSQRLLVSQLVSDAKRQA